MDEEWNPLPKEPKEEEEKLPPKEPEVEEVIPEAPDEPEVDEPESDPEEDEAVPGEVLLADHLADEEEPEEPEPEPEKEEEIFFQKVRNSRRTGLDARGQEIYDKFDTIGRKSYLQVLATPAELEHLEKLGRIRRIA